MYTYTYNITANCISLEVSLFDIEEVVLSNKD
jgi:hypothetical protein